MYYMYINTINISRHEEVYSKLRIKILKIMIVILLKCDVYEKQYFDVCFITILLFRDMYVNILEQITKHKPKKKVVQKNGAATAWSARILYTAPLMPVDVTILSTHLLYQKWLTGPMTKPMVNIRPRIKYTMNVQSSFNNDFKHIFVNINPLWNTFTFSTFKLIWFQNRWGWCGLIF